VKKQTLSSRPPLRHLMQLALALGLWLVGGEALASTLTQNSSWTIDRAGTTAKYRVVAYGDSIYAGYNGSLSNVDRRAASWVQGEYLSNAWNADIEVIRRAKSGAKADDIYNNKIVAERSHMQAANTRVVSFEMCGNDFLQARSAFADQSGTCNLGVIDSALAACTTYQERAMQTINQYANPAALKMVMNIYYPGYDADNSLSTCTVNGQRINKQEAFLPRLARSNYRACNFARAYGFVCVDSFAAWMGADYDSNGDGVVDAEALRFSPDETEDQYVARILQLRSTLRDANGHLASAGTSFDYLLSDNTHPTYSGPTISTGFLGGTASGTSAPDYSNSQIVGGKNPVFNRFGHESLGFIHSLLNRASP
jgi:lysophospholipase L1-like esterase